MEKGFILGAAAYAKICEVEGIKIPSELLSKYSPLVKEDKMEVAKDKLKSFIDRIERLEEERANLGADIRDIFAVAKSDGFDIKAMKQIIRLRKKAKEERDEELNAIDVYLHALEMI